MLVLVAGLIIFFAVHVFIVRKNFKSRSELSARDKRIRLVHGLVSLLGFVLIVYGFHLYRLNGYTPLWQPPLALKHLALLLNLPVFILISAAFFRGWIKYRLKYPMLVAIKLWALAHLCANGDLGALVLFGSFLAWAVVLRILAKKRNAPLPPLDRTVAIRNDMLSILIGLSIYITMLHGLHLALIGVSPY